MKIRPRNYKREKKIKGLNINDPFEVPVIYSRNFLGDYKQIKLNYNLLEMEKTYDILEINCCKTLRINKKAKDTFYYIVLRNTIHKKEIRLSVKDFLRLAPELFKPDSIKTHINKIKVLEVFNKEYFERLSKLADYREAETKDAKARILKYYNSFYYKFIKNREIFNYKRVYFGNVENVDRYIKSKKKPPIIKNINEQEENKSVSET